MEKQILALQLSHILGENFSRDWVYKHIEIPKKGHFGDLAFPCFLLAKTFRKSPQSIAEEISPQLKHTIYSHAEAVGGYINIFLNKEFVSQHTLKQVVTNGSHYGNCQFGNGKTVVLDMSSPNIAKPFSMGHLRSTVIGQAISNLADKCGYQPVKINYIGDYGTQFGKLLAAYKNWGDPGLIKADPIKELTKIYVKFHEAAKENPSLIEEGRQWFKKLENQDKEALELWKWFKQVSLSEFDRIYELLGVKFDLTRGEAYYNDKMEKTVETLRERNLLEKSDGAQIVRLQEESLPPCLIRKSDGTTIYATRDLTAAIDRYQSYTFDEALYVVGHEQTLHFHQVVHVLKKMGMPWADRIKHIPFGMMLKDGKKMSTRSGQTVLLEEVLHKAIQQAAHNIEEKNPDLPDKQEVAKQVGVGAVIFHDLKHDRRNDVEFSIEEMLRFEGHTAPYLQYTYVRAASILEKASFTVEQACEDLIDEDAWDIIKLIRSFPSVIEESYLQYDPSKLAKYLLDLAKAFNKYYASMKVLGSENEMARLTLIYSMNVVLKEGLSLLGIETPEKM